MERKIGEIFEYQGKKLKAVDGENKCDKCYFYKDNYCTRIDRIAGQCLTSKRTDNKSVNFIEVTEEQPQELNLCKILKNCPEGFELYSPLYGKVIFSGIGKHSLNYPIDCTDYKGNNISFTKEGYFYKMYSDAECLLYPSKDQRDWSKFTAPWYKKEKFDPKTLQPFDKVLAKDSSTSLWRIALFSHMIKSRVFSCVCMHTNFMYCIPYNDETKHLIGTTDEAPEYYRYWED